jgi:hypothetical protein
MGYMGWKGRVTKEGSIAAEECWGEPLTRRSGARAKPIA